MAKLTAAQRKKLPASDFALPEQRAYPIEDATHARAALSRVEEFGSSAQKRQVLAAVRRHFPNMQLRDN